MSEPAADVPTPRAKPQYGEYATPEEVAIARGIPVDRGANEHVSRLAQPLPPPPEPRGRHPRPASPRPVAVRHPAHPSTMITVLLLVFGIWNTVTAIPTFLDLGAVLSTGFETLGYGSVTFGPVAHVAGIVMLVFTFLLLIAAVGLSLRRIRAGKASVRVPLIAGAAWALGYFIAVVVIVANTPGVAAVLQNRS